MIFIALALHVQDHDMKVLVVFPYKHWYLEALSSQIYTLKS